MGLLNKQEALARIPQVDQLLQDEALHSLLEEVPRYLVLDGVRLTLQKVRREILTSEDLWYPDDFLPRESLCRRIQEQVRLLSRPSLHSVINASGVLLHTNLGRAVLSSAAISQLVEVASGYANVEIDEHSGERGERYTHVRELLCRLSGAEDALVVNNNAAAVLLSLSALAVGRQVIVSRGEQVEVGGAFRVPEVMRQSGCHLVEVGTTNRTYLRDYLAAITSETAALLKVHTSNYRVIGFTAEVSREDLVSLAHQHSLLALEDLGSGTLVDLSHCGLSHEPTVQEAIRAGMDLVTFSGDKLLGGPQAGIIVGKKACLDRLKLHPLLRALRIDKLTLAALEATLRLYLDEEQVWQRVPVLRLLSQSVAEITDKAEKLCQELQQRVGDRAEFKVEEDYAVAGGGALPLEEIPTRVVSVVPREISVSRLDERLRLGFKPIFSRIARERLLLDLRTVFDNELSELADAVVFALKEQGS